MIVINANVDPVTLALARLRTSAIPAAAVEALTDTARQIAIAEVREMRDVFDRPTPWTLGSVKVTPASRGSYKATVALKDFAGKGVPATKFLAAEITGGRRAMKASERAFRSVGIMPDGYRMVPGPGAKVDAYGNMDRGQIVQILAYFKALQQTSGYRGNMTDKKRAKLYKGTKRKQGFAYFVRNSGRNVVIFQSTRFLGGNAVRPVIIFVPFANYEARYDYPFVAQHIAATMGPRLFQQALSAELAKGAA